MGVINGKMGVITATMGVITAQIGVITANGGNKGASDISRLSEAEKLLQPAPGADNPHYAAERMCSSVYASS